MSPKAAAKPRKPSSEATTAAADERSIEQDLRELLPLFPRAIQGLKRGRPHLPAPLRDTLEQELAPRHIPVVMGLAVEGPMGVSEIAEWIGLSVPTASLFVGELDRAGVVTRREDSNDRRRTIVALDEDYEQTLGNFLRDGTRPIRRTLERLDPKARAHFIEGWRILAEEATGGEPAPGDEACDD
jgi:DNA-binding MarR family transcriptional regulator